MIASDVQLCDGVIIPQPDLVNLYGCTIGAGTKIGSFVEVQRGAHIGAYCKISSHTFVCEGVSIEDGVFVGHGVMFINDLHPRAVTSEGGLQTTNDWQLMKTVVKSNVSIGSNATILGGITIGRGAMIGAGAVVTHNIPDHAVVAGNPAHVIGDSRERRYDNSCSDLEQRTFPKHSI